MPIWIWVYFVLSLLHEVYKGPSRGPFLLTERGYYALGDGFFCRPKRIFCLGDGGFGLCGRCFGGSTGGCWGTWRVKES